MREKNIDDHGISDIRPALLHEGTSKKPSRTYPGRECPNPICLSEGMFIPHRKNQIYCCIQCRINYNNDKREQLDNTTFSKLKVLKAIDKKLNRLHQRYFKDGNCKVLKEILDHENINLKLFVTEKTNTTTQGTVKFFFRYGLELCPGLPYYYLIHKFK